MTSFIKKNFYSFEEIKTLQQLISIQCLRYFIKHFIASIYIACKESVTDDALILSACIVFTVFNQVSGCSEGCIVRFSFFPDSFQSVHTTPCGHVHGIIFYVKYVSLASVFRRISGMNLTLSCSFVVS